MKVIGVLVIALCIWSVQAAVPKTLGKLFNEKFDAIALMKQTKFEAIANGNRVIEECDEYLEIMNDAVERQKDETNACTTTHSDDIEAAETSTQPEADALHVRAQSVGDNLKKCEELDLIEGLDCLTRTTETEQKEMSKLQSDSAKLKNKHNRKVSTADNSFEFCKTDATYFYSDVITDIMSLHRECVLYGDKEDYEIPEFVRS